MKTQCLIIKVNTVVSFADWHCSCDELGNNSSDEMCFVTVSSEMQYHLYIY